MMTSYGTIVASQKESITPAPTAMQTAATANGNGVDLSVDGYATAVLQILGSISGGSTVNFKVSADGTNWSSILGTLVGSTTTGTSTQSLGDWVFNVAGFLYLRAVISSYGGGSITVNGYTSVVAGPATGASATTVAVTQSGTWANQILDAGGTNKASVSAGGALKVDGSASTQPVTGTFWQTTQPVSASALPLPSNAAKETGGNLDTLASAISSGKMVTNLTSVAGTTVSTGSGSSDSGTIRVMLASDSQLATNQAVNVSQVAGNSTATGSGTTTTGTIRTTIATDCNVNTNLSLINNTTVSTSNGVANSGCQRVTIASDNTAFNVKAANCNLDTINTVAVTVGNGTANSGCQRVTIASDNTAFSVNNTPPANQTVDLNKVAGTATPTGNGTAGAGGVQRVTIASDNTAFSVNNTPPANQTVDLNKVAGSAMPTGNGTAGAGGVQRVAIASDNTAFSVNNTPPANQTVDLNKVAGAAMPTGNGTAGAGGVQRVAIASDNSPVPMSFSGTISATVSPPTVPTFMVCNPTFVVATTSVTDMISFSIGTGTITCKIQRIRLYSYTNSAESTCEFFLIKRVTLNTGGGLTNYKGLSLDSGDGIQSNAVITTYTSNPTLGSTPSGTNGVLSMPTVIVPLSGASSFYVPPFYDLYVYSPTSKPLTIKSNASMSIYESICLNFNQVNIPSGLKLKMEVIWTEE